jgi:alcohol dehydrogenase (cytochrome c)
VFKGVEPGTGRPIVDPAHKPGVDKLATFCPSLWGGKDWPPAAYSPSTRLLYIPANENLCSEVNAKVVKYVAGEPYTGVTTNVLRIRAGADHVGEVQAWNLDTGKKVWTTKLPTENWGPVLATAGDVVFSGGTADRLFRAFDAKTGEVLWQFPTISGINGVPVSFAVDGQQYIAVQTGWGVDAARMQGRLNLLFPGKYADVPQGGAVYVFAVK